LLCIEDDPTLKLILDPLLREIDPLMRVRWVDSAEAGFERIEEASRQFEGIPFHLVITDIFLEGKITGIDLWSICRSTYPQMPVLVMSSLPFGKFLDFKGAQDGISPPYLQKPLNIPVCRRIIERALRGEVSDTQMALR